MTGESPNYLSKNFRGGIASANIEHQDAVAAILAVEALRGRGVLDDLLTEERDTDDWMLGGETWDDIVFTAAASRVFVQVKTEVVTVGLLQKICSAFEAAERLCSAYRCSFRLQAVGGVEPRLHTLPLKLREMRGLLRTNESHAFRVATQALAESFGLQEVTISRLCIDTRRIIRDDEATIALFCHLVRLSHPFRDFGDAALNRLFRVLLDDLFAEARRKRLTVSGKEIARKINDTLVSSRELDFELIEHSTSGYRPRRAQSSTAAGHASVATRAATRIRAEWRRKQLPRGVETLLTAPFGRYRWETCPECGHLLMGNFLGVSGLGCPDCGYFPILTLAYACDCSAHFVILRQPKLVQEALEDHISRFLDDKSQRCKGCGRPPNTELPMARLLLFPFPSPVEEYFQFGHAAYMSKYHRA